jgi:hypothetical protein
MEDFYIGEERFRGWLLLKYDALGAVFHIPYLTAGILFELSFL